MITKTRGRTLMVQFKCGRCGRTHIEPYEKQLKDTEGNLQCYNPPKGWKDDELYTPMLCAECNEAYIAFMKILHGADQSDKCKFNPDGVCSYPPDQCDECPANPQNDDPYCKGVIG